MTTPASSLYNGVHVCYQRTWEYCVSLYSVCGHVSSSPTTGVVGNKQKLVCLYTTRVYCNPSRICTSVRCCNPGRGSTSARYCNPGRAALVPDIVILALVALKILSIAKNCKFSNKCLQPIVFLIQ